MARGWRGLSHVGSPPSSSPDAPAQPTGTFGQGKRGPAGYEDHGGSETEWVPDDPAESEHHEQA